MKPHNILHSLTVASQYDACASVTTGSAVETNGRMYAGIHQNRNISNLTYVYILPLVSIALQVVMRHFENPPSRMMYFCT